MTSTLPDYSSSPLNSPAADTSPLALLFPASGSGAGPDSGPVPGFDTLMDASPGPVPGPSPLSPVSIIAGANSPTRMLSNPVPVAAPGGLPVQSVMTGYELNASQTYAGVAPVDPMSPPPTTSLPAGRREITRDMLEAAASFVTTLLQAALPEVQVPQFSGVSGQGEPGTSGTAGNPTGANPVSAKSQTQSQAADPTAGQLAPGVPMATPEFTLATDGAMELKLDLAQLKPAGSVPALPADVNQTLSISAELQRPGEIVVRLEAAATVPAPDAPAPAGVAGRANIAAKYPGLTKSVESFDPTEERKFVFTGDKQVKTQSMVTGISVAKPGSTMPAAPIEVTRSSRSPELFSGMPGRVEFQAVLPPAERTNVPADVPAGQNFAERAVDTVTSLVDTQFSASLQKSGSVQLRLRFGGEDLSVRVEIRDGAVHTDFQTDSAELRSALTREWQTLAGQSPEQMRRYLDPVFSPAAASAPAASDPSSSYTRQQQSSQQDQSSRSPREPWAESASPFSRRSQLSDSFIPEPAVTRVPAFLPTSHRLSVLA